MREVEKVSPEELQFIFNFCKKKGFEFVDLRMELVDHLASQVEAVWQKEPELSFKTAFHKVYKSYGIFGFNNLYQVHSKLVWKKYWTLTKQEFMHWFKPPQIFASLLAGLLCYFGLSAFPFLGFYIWCFIYLGIVATMIYMIFKSKTVAKRIDKEQTMLLSSPRQFWWIFYLGYTLPLQMTSFSFVNQKSWGVLFTTLFLLISLLFIIANFKIIRLAEEQVYSIKSRLAYYHP